MSTWRRNPNPSPFCSSRTPWISVRGPLGPGMCPPPPAPRGPRRERPPRDRVRPRPPRDFAPPRREDLRPERCPDPPAFPPPPPPPPPEPDPPDPLRPPLRLPEPPLRGAFLGTIPILLSGLVHAGVPTERRRNGGMRRDRVCVLGVGSQDEAGLRLPAGRRSVHEGDPHGPVLQQVFRIHPCDPSAHRDTGATKTGPIFELVRPTRMRLIHHPGTGLSETPAPLGELSLGDEVLVSEPS